jgi:hypothetical protein
VATCVGNARLGRVAADEGGRIHARAVGDLARMLGRAATPATLSQKQGAQEGGDKDDTRPSPQVAACTIPQYRQWSASGGGRGSDPTPLAVDEARTAAVESYGLSELTTAIHMAIGVALRASDDA